MRDPVCSAERSQGQIYSVGWLRHSKPRIDPEYIQILLSLQGFLGGSDSKELAYNIGDLGSIPGSGRFPWRREWLPTPVFLPGKFHGQRSLAAYCTWYRKELDTTEQYTRPTSKCFKSDQCFTEGSQRVLQAKWTLLPCYFDSHVMTCHTGQPGDM